MGCAKAKAESGLATAATPAAVTNGDDNGAFCPVATTARPSLGMEMPCNGCGCGAMANGPNILGIMQQQQQYMLMQQQQMGMFNHMMMMGAMMGPMMGQIIAPAAPADGTSILSGVNPSTLPDPAMSLGKVVDEDDDVPPGPSTNINHPNYRPPDSEQIPGVTDRRWEGRIKMWFDDKGYGFITNEELKKRFKDLDVFLHQNQKRHFRRGDLVTFSVYANYRGQPQATELRRSKAEA